MKITPTRRQEIALLRRRLRESELTQPVFAEECLMHSERSLRNWLAGVYPIPRVVVNWLRNPSPRRPWPKRRRR